MDKYSWNFDYDAEDWYESADTIEECIAQAKASCDRKDYWLVYIGENVPFVPTIDGRSLLEDFSVDALNYCDAARDWCPEDAKQEAIQELSEQLNSIVMTWLKKHNYEPDFWRVQNIKRYNLEG